MSLSPQNSLPLPISNTNTSFIDTFALEEKRKSRMVSSLVEATIWIVQSIWSSSNERHAPSARKTLPLKSFIEETLKRSRTSYSTLQISLYYLMLAKPTIFKKVYSKDVDVQKKSGLLCGRRAFLTSLIIASKYLQDRNYSIKAWSKISGLSTSELSTNEIEFLKAVDWNLHVPSDVYEHWSNVLSERTKLAFSETVEDEVMVENDELIINKNSGPTLFVGGQSSSSSITSSDSTPLTSITLTVTNDAECALLKSSQSYFGNGPTMPSQASLPVPALLNSTHMIDMDGDKIDINSLQEIPGLKTPDFSPNTRCEFHPKQLVKQQPVHQISSPGPSEIRHDTIIDQKISEINDSSLLLPSSCLKRKRNNDVDSDPSVNDGVLNNPVYGNNDLNDDLNDDLNASNKKIRV
ncbi:hypothetical protein NADFUDRAFT_63685 [Nadsonia fulvescens var. elongata DSM 6958]|uniref:Cyclin-domain-containing protein n=1 Tax=Nadsonia fulvescens var. elongata DSM 6958 TaxID=857566 RepID=A0A1E3PS14_9ASCO|nr:hypothetical protein NADFUDRAFT_63685 [Nadsonia fulvescens var. elongata DSM 6958]